MSASRRLPITQVDAFADRAFTGNPAAVMPLEEWLPDAVLQAIAAENNLAETAFLVPDESEESDYELRWFTPGAGGCACAATPRWRAAMPLLSAAPWRSDMSFRTRKAGILRVARNGEDDGYKMALPAFARRRRRRCPTSVRALGGDPVARRCGTMAAMR
jgi:PhzF family phenazine biosynthesis protein